MRVTVYLRGGADAIAGELTGSHADDAMLMVKHALRMEAPIVLGNPHGGEWVIPAQAVVAVLVDDPRDFPKDGALLALRGDES